MGSSDDCLTHSVAYTTFYVLGLLLSMQVPFVGMQPIRTSEHMASAGFVAFLLFAADFDSTLLVRASDLVWI